MHAETVAAADHQHHIAGVKFAAGDQTVFVVVDINPRVSLQHDQHLGRADQLAVDREVHVAGDHAAGWVDDVADLLLEFRRGHEGRTVRQLPAPHDIG